MSGLLLRTVSQGLQAFMPIAAALAWFWRSADRRRASAVRNGLIASIPAAAIGGWWFQHSPHRALDQALLSDFSVVIGVACFVALWRQTPSHRDPRTRELSSAAYWALGTAATVVVARQTSEIGSVLAAAVFQLRSLDATLTLLKGVAIAGVVAWLWTRLGRLLPPSAITSATQAVAAVFLAQVILYAFHETAEARLLPWSDALHAATEPYGPEGIYGIHLSDLLIAAPVAAAVGSLARALMPAGRLGAWWAVAERRLTAGMLIGGSFLLVGMQSDDSRPVHPTVGASATDVAALVRRPHILFRDTAPGATFGRLTLAALEVPGERLSLALSCDRVSFRSGHGICLHTERGVFHTYTAVLLDSDLKPGSSIKLGGLPSRTRTAPDGRVGAATVFVLGDGYASPFSTRTTILDLSTGDEIGELEQFATWRNGVRFRAVDFNFWGVTFAHDGNTFYASLRTNNVTYLVRGELALRKLTALRDNVECPALSPDDRLLAYKKRVGPSPDSWRLHVLDLASNTERIISGETRYIDDQVEWLDGQHVLYAVPRRTTSISDVWVAPIDGSAAARIFLPEAESPIVVR